MAEVHYTRLISQLTKNTYALILAGGKGSRLYELTQFRAKPALYFGGQFRIIDFPLSNCVNSGIRRIGVITQYKAHSLIRHLVRAWGHFKKELGEGVEILPASQWHSENWYQGTADAVYQNVDIIRDEIPELILILSGDHVYRQDYGEMLATHAELAADMTVSCMEVPIEEAAGAFGVMEVDENFRVVGFEEKPAHPKPVPGNPEMCLASMGNYVFNTEFLFDQLRMDSENLQSDHDFGKNIIPGIIKNHKVYAYRFVNVGESGEAYWKDVGTLDAYWKANLQLALPKPPMNLYDKRWPIWTYQEQLPPAKFVFNDDYRRGFAVDSMVASGTIISGSRLAYSVMFPSGRLNSYSNVEESVLLPEVNVGRYCKIQRAIIDRGCDIPDRTEIGYDPDADREKGFRVTEGGVTLVTRTMLGQSTNTLGTS